MSLMPRPPAKSKQCYSQTSYRAWDLIEDANNSVTSKNHLFPVDSGLIIEPPKDGLRVRNVMEACASYRIIYSVPSQKNKRMIDCESFNESCMAYLLEAHPKVIEFVEQPVILKWVDKSGISHRHIPDFKAALRSGLTLFLEVKSDSALFDEEIISRTELLSQSLSSIGFMYMVLTTSQIQGIELNNAKQIIKFENHYLNNSDLFDIETLFNYSKGSLSLAEVDNLEKVSKVANLSGKVRTLIRSGVIAIDYKKEFKTSSLLFWKGSN
jgi:hypothetical protein